MKQQLASGTQLAVPTMRSNLVCACAVPERPHELKLPSELFYASCACAQQALFADMRSRFKMATQGHVRREPACEVRRPPNCLVHRRQVRSTWFDRRPSPVCHSHTERPLPQQSFTGHFQEQKSAPLRVDERSLFSADVTSLTNFDVSLCPVVQ